MHKPFKNSSNIGAAGERSDPELNQAIDPIAPVQASNKMRSGLTRRSSGIPVPLSFEQQRIWFLDQIQGTSTEYNLPEAIRLRGRLNLQALECAINAIIGRHEVLRTYFKDGEAGPLQVAMQDLHIDLPVEDLTGLDEAVQQEKVSAAISSEWDQPFDLRRGPLLRVKVLKLSQDEHILLRTFHYIGFDSKSAELFNTELGILYEAFDQGLKNVLEQLPFQYGDFALWERGSLHEGAMADDLKYWKDQLRGIPEELELPKDRGRGERQIFAAQACPLILEEDKLAGLRRLCEVNQTTLYVPLVSAFAVLLRLYTGVDDIVLGSPITNRKEAGLEELIGFFVNPLVMRFQVQAEWTFQKVLDSVCRVTWEAHQHQGLPFELLVKELSPHRRLNMAPIFQVEFWVEDQPAALPQFTKLGAERVPHQRSRVGFDLEVDVWAHANRVEFQWIYNLDLFDRWRIEQMVRHYARVLEQMTEAPTRRICDIELMSIQEKHEVLVLRNQTQKFFDSDATLHRLFERQVARTPGTLAILYENRRLTYDELNRRANQLAHYLREMAVGPEVLIGICIERSFEMVIAVLGVLKTGAGYVPIDPNIPADRIALIMTHSRISVLLTQHSIRNRISANRASVIEIDSDWNEISSRQEINLPITMPLEHVAYVIYTSGSTGVPKGVAITHKGIASLSQCLSDHLSITTSSRVLQFSSLGFDVSVFEMVAALTLGGALVLMRNEMRTGIDLQNTLTVNGITHALLPPAVLPTLDNCDEVPLGTLIVGGDTCSGELAARWSSSRLMLNAYGPTEATVTTTITGALSGAQAPPIGAPIWNTRVYVLDHLLQPVITGMKGELYIAGAGLARGYLWQSGLTAERFVADPFGNPGARMYRTGDVVRWRPDGVLEFFGRADWQVKVRGHRVELGEIEAVLRQHSQVQDALVIKREEKGNEQLFGYVIAGHDEPSPEIEIRSQLVDNWRQIYEGAYEESTAAAGNFNVIGWNSSYTGQPIPLAEMRIWVEETVKRLRALSPNRVLEIGCGTGLVLTRLAPFCKSYTGMDFSSKVLAQLDEYLKKHEELHHVVLSEGVAHDLSKIEDNTVDLVVLNSVAQYFPSMGYLIRVLEEAVRITQPGGNIFIGDVRSLPLLEAFHASVQLYRASPEVPLRELHRKIWESCQSEQELVVDPALFGELSQAWEKIGCVDIAFKAGACDNELSRFRYDVTLSLGEKKTVNEPERWLTWGPSQAWKDELTHLLSVGPTMTVGVRGIQNRRTEKALRALQLLTASAHNDSTTAELRAACEGNADGEDPDDLNHLGERLGVKVWLKHLNANGSFDLIFNPRWTRLEYSAKEMPDHWYQRYGNVPVAHAGVAKLGLALRESLQRSLPEYMVPAAIVVLDAWPMTANGKLDRNALPIPERRTEYHGSAPRDPQAEILCGIFAEVLGLENVAVDANFFDLGGHSLMAAQLVNRIRAVLGVELPVRAIFEAPAVVHLLPRLQNGNQQIHPRLVPKQRQSAQLPLSYGQQRLWFLQQLDQSNTDYNWPEAMYLRGELDLHALERAVNRIVERHEVLRTRYEEIEGTAVQIIEPALRIYVPLEDLSSLSAVAQQERIAISLQSEWEKPFDLSKGPLLRLQLFRLERQTHLLVRTVHHIVWDSWSEGIFNREFILLYQAFRDGLQDPLGPLPVQYADFALWQSGLGEESLIPSLEYWTKQLANIPEELELPRDRPRSSHYTSEAGLCLATLPAGELLKLRQIGRSSGATMYMTLLAVFAVLLERYSGQSDVVVGSPIANRQDPQLEQLLGFFLNSLVMRIPVQGRKSFCQLLSVVRTVTLDAYRHYDLPFERLVEQLSPQRILNAMPIFQVVFEFQNAPAYEHHLKELEVEPLPAEHLRVRCDVELHAWESDGALTLQWIYSRQLFEPWRIEQLAESYLRLLRGVLERTDWPLGQISVLSAEEREQLLAGWNKTWSSFTDELLVHERFAEQAASTPGRIAVISGERRLTYGELNERANKLAQFLQHFGTGPEARVCICLERGIDALMAILAILKTGAAYVPLDPAYPQERLRFMIRDAQSSLVVTQRRFQKHFSDCELHVVCTDQDWPEISKENAANPKRRSTRENLAYIIYTSGSTGTPKGVLITHSGLSNVIAESARLFGINELSTVAQLASLSFDASVLEIFSTFYAGARLCVVDSSTLLLGTEFSGTLETHRITTIATPPSLMNAVLEGDYSALQTIVAGGEVCTPETVARWSRGRKFLNAYAPTEATIYSTIFECREGTLAPFQSVPVGRPIANTRIYILDRDMAPVPVGVRGEIYIAGAGVARGYWQRAELTAERFLPDPFSQGPGARFYRTGDMGRYRPDGHIEFLGRSDQQIKLRGFRIELGEIEAVLYKHPAVREVAVITRNDLLGEKQLVGYVVPNEGCVLKTTELRNHAARYLPNYMVPAAIVLLKQFPLTVHGKLDLQNLPSPEFQANHSYRVSRTPEEEMLCEIFARVLNVGNVSIDDNFFELGGHSLLAARLVSQIRAVLGAELGLRAIFETPTVEGLSARIRQTPSKNVTLASTHRPALLPVSYAQQRLWFIDRLRGTSAEYNMPQAFRLRGTLDREALQQAIDVIVERHEVLRTRFDEADGVPVQIIAPELRIEVPVEDLSAMDGSTQRTRLSEALALEWERPFHLSQGPLLRMKLLRFQEEEHILLRTFHHIVCDGWSLAIFEREFEVLYEAFAEGRENPLKPLPIQYADFTLWDRAQLGEESIAPQLAYWKEQLKDVPEELELPKDRRREQYQTFAAGYFATTLEQKVLAELKELSQASGATQYMALLAAFAVLLARYTGQQDMVLGSPIANRHETQLEDLIGFFVNSLAIRVRVKAEHSFPELLAEVRATALEAYQNSTVSFERVVEEISPVRALNRTPIFQITFAHYHVALAPQQMRHVQVEPIESEEAKTRFDLELHVFEDQGEAQLHWIYNRDLFGPWRIKDMAQHYETLLKTIVISANKPISDLQILSEQEQVQLIQPGIFNEASIYGKCIHELFEEQVERMPESVALIYKDEQLTYRELNERANRLARYLRTQGIGPDIVVGILMDRCSEMIVAILAALKAGGAYLPLDTNGPPERLAAMLQDSKTPLILSQSIWSNVVSEGRTAVFCLDTNRDMIAVESGANLFRIAAPENLAYVIYTSGSTGHPKGTEVPHKSIPGFFFGAVYARYDAQCVLLQHSSISWDGFTLELWPALLRGGRSVLYHERLLTAADLAGYVERYGITVLWLTSSLLSSIVETYPESLAAVPEVLIGGEALSVPHVSKLLDMLPHVKLVNGYGPSECTVFSTCYEIPEDFDRKAHSVSIGQPVGDRRVYVLDPWFNLAPPGAVGELYVGGPAVARGYLNRPALTAEKFLPDPFAKEEGARLYRTGDLVRRRADHLLEFVGRTDDQGKIRGYRIEPGEVESVLARHPAVQESAVVISDNHGEKELKAFWVCKPGSETSATEIRGHLRDHLPEYMVPSRLMEIPSLPLTVTGKVDRRRLSKLDVQTVYNNSFIAPQNEMQRTIAGIWQKVLRKEKVGVFDNFFDLGGHSLLVVQVHGTLKNRVHQPFKLLDLFTYPTVASLAEYLTGNNEAQGKETSSCEHEINLRENRKEREQRFSKRAIIR